MIVGCYTLDLYCDNDDCPHRRDKDGGWHRCQYTGEFGAACRKEARKDGWTLDHKRTLCPSCNATARKHRKRPKPPETT